MKVYKQEHKEIVRISFGSKHSISFEDTSVNEVYDLTIKVLSKMKLKRTININGSPFDRPTKELSIILSVRHESGAYKLRGYKGKSKSKTMFGITGIEAKEYFEKHYKDHL